MPLVANLIERRQTISTTSSNPAKWLLEFFGGTPTKSGVKVNERNALELSAVYAAVTVVSESVASLPAILYERMERGKQRASAHPVYRILHDRPNPLMTPYQFFETGQAHIDLWGNFYAEIERNRRGDVIALWPLLPDRTSVEVIDSKKVFETRVGSHQRVLLSEDRVLHIPGPGFDGLVGRSRIRLARESLGLTKATEQFGATFFGQGARLSGILSHPGSLKKPEKVRKVWEDTFGGLDNSQRVAVLEEGMTWTQLGVPPDDSQFLETRKFQITEVARWFRVPPHKIGDLERATFTNIESENQSFHQETLVARVKRWEQGLAWSLLSDTEQRNHFVEFLVTALLRGDSTARGEFYTKRFQMGSLSPNDIRELENENPIEGGDQYFVQLNMVPLSMAEEAAAQSAAPEPEPEPEDDDRQVKRLTETRSVTLRQRQRAAHIGLLKQASERVLKGELTKLDRGIKAAFTSRRKRDFGEFLTTFYADHDETVARAFRPVFAAYAANMAAAIAQELGIERDISFEVDRFVAEYTATFSKRWAASSRHQLEALVEKFEEEEVEAALRTRLDEWSEKRADKTAANESVRSGEAFVRTAYVALGIQFLRWITVGKNCPMCDSLSGKVVGTRESFLEKGATVNTGDVAPLTTRSSINHPPLHNGCDCLILPG